MATKAQRRKAKLFSNRSRCIGSGFKVCNCWKLHNILIKIQNSRLHQMSEKASKNDEDRILLLRAGWMFFNPERLTPLAQT